MRRIFLLLFLFNLGLNGYSQETEISTIEEEFSYAGKHELKLNALYLLLGFPELSYEHVLNEESSLGVSVAFAIEEVFEINFLAIPYYRIFFGNKPAAGFFVEGNAAFYSVDHDEHMYYEGYVYEERTENKLGAGVGLAIGGKFMTKSRWIFEVFGGAGRNFVNSDDLGAAYPRLGLTVGKRF